LTSKRFYLTPDGKEAEGCRWAEVRELNGLDRRNWRLAVDKVRQGKAPATIERPDPANTAMMQEVPNPDPAARWHVEDDVLLYDQLAGWVVTAWSLPVSLPYEPQARACLTPAEDIAFDKMLAAVQSELVSGPKQESGTADTTSVTSSPGDAPAPLPEPTPRPSGNASGSSGDGSAPEP
jgi:hypothetical protein